MNGPYFSERFSTSEIVEKPELDTNNPEVNLDPFIEKVPMDAALIQEGPIGGTDVAFGAMTGPLADEVPMSGTVAVAGLVDETIVSDAPVRETVLHEAATGTSAIPPEALLNREESEHFRTRWNEIQGRFVDEPRSAVQQADALVSEVIEKITQMFSSERSSLEGQWKEGNDVSTEDLRKALQHYRSFFNRLVA